MQIKVFKAGNMKDAMAAMKAELGEDAVILHSKKYKEGGILGIGSREVVEITAAVEESSLPRRIETPKLHHPTVATGVLNRYKTDGTAQGVAKAERTVENFAAESAEENSPRLTQVDTLAEKISAQQNSAASPKNFEDVLQETQEDSFPTNSAGDTVSETIGEYQSAETESAPVEEYQSAEIEPAPVEEYQSAEVESAPVEEYQSTETESAPVEEYQSTETESAPVEEYQSAEMKSSPVEEYQSAEVEPAQVDEYQSAEVESAQVDEYQSTEIEPAQVDEYQSAENEPAQVDEYQSAETESAPVEEYQSAEAEPAPVEEYQSTEVESAKVDESKSAEIEPANVEESKSAETESAKVEEPPSPKVELARVEEPAPAKIDLAPAKKPQPAEIKSAPAEKSQPTKVKSAPVKKSQPQQQNIGFAQEQLAQTQAMILAQLNQMQMMQQAAIAQVQAQAAEQIRLQQAQQAAIQAQPVAQSDEKLKRLEEEIAQMKALMIEILGRESNKGGVSLHEALKMQEVDEEILKEMAAQANAGDTLVDMHAPAARATLTNYLNEHMKFSDGVKLNRHGVRIVALLGTTGVGKTTTLAKIAAKFVLEQRANVALITADTYRISAVEQLKTYSDILELPLEIVYNPQELASAIERHRHKELVLIDTAGRSQHNEYQMRELEEFLRVNPRIEKHLVISATTKFTDAKQIMSKFSKVNPDRIIFTKIDETGSLGMIVNLLNDSNYSLSYITTGQSVPDDIERANAEVLTSLLLRKVEE